MIIEVIVRLGKRRDHWLGHHHEHHGSPTPTDITVSVPDDVYRAARIRAAEWSTSVSALVAEYLISVARNDAEFERLAEQQRRIVGEIHEFRTGRKLGPDELHERAFVDTSILLYAISRDTSEHQKALQANETLDGRDRASRPRSSTRLRRSARDQPLRRDLIPF